MDWKRIFKRRRWLFNIPTILWVIVWEFTKDTLIEVTRNYFIDKDKLMSLLDWLLQHPSIIAIMVALAVFVSAFVDTRKEKRDSLKIIVQKSIVKTFMSYNPIQGKTTNLLEISISSPFQKITEVEVNIKVVSIGEIKVETIKLHIGANSYKVKELPVVVIEREATYTITFEVPPHVIEQTINNKARNYIQVLGNNWGWRSDDFTIK